MAGAPMQVRRNVWKRMSSISPELRWFIVANLLGLAAVISYLCVRRLVLLIPALLLSPLPGFLFARLTSPVHPEAPSNQAGLGIALLPDFITEHAVLDGKLQVVLPDWSPPPIAVHALFPSSRTMPSKTRIFVDYLVEALRRSLDAE